MKFLNRDEEQRRLDKLCEIKEASLAVVWGRRRVGKSRLLLEWVERHRGVYYVADESTATLQRKFLATTLEQVLPGFASVDYPNWSSLFTRLAQDARRVGFRGPIVIDELPYLIEAAPEITSVLQKFVDLEAKDANLILALCGSSQRMMHGAVLDASAPLYGRAHELLKLSPLAPKYLQGALGLERPEEAVAHYAIWGGIPRYWELVERHGGSLVDCALDLVLNPMGPLHDEPQRLLREERPPAISLRPILEAIGLGCHRLSEIGGRLGQQATSLSRPLIRLREMDLVEREVPYGVLEQDSKRALYKIKDPFVRFWFALIAPRHSLFLQAPLEIRRQWLQEALPHLCSKVWEDLCRKAAPFLAKHVTDKVFAPAGRFWHGSSPEWDVVTESHDREVVFIGEVKWTSKAPTASQALALLEELKHKGLPPTSLKEGAWPLYALFVPEKPKGLKLPANMKVFDAHDVLMAG